MAETRQPTQIESARWETFRNRYERKTKPLVQALIVFAKLADSAQSSIESITGTRPNIIDAKQAAIINELGRRARILDNQITGVLLQKYAVQIDDEGNLNIVGASAPEGDIYPRDEALLGLAPIIIAAGIFAVTLLIAGDDANDALEKQARIEALKLQQKMLQADREMMKRPEPERKQWEAWKKNAAATAKQAAASIEGSQSWLEKFIGKKGTSILTAGIIGVAALYFLLPALRRN